MTIHEGATLWARQTIDSTIFASKPDKWFKIWFYLVNRVNYRDSKKFKRGQCLMKYEWIQANTGATKAQIDMFIRWSKKVQMLTTQKTTRGMIVTILNYNYFQDLDNYKNDTENEMKTIHKRYTNDRGSKVSKKEKKEKKKETTLSSNPENGIPYQEIIDYLNEKTGRNFKVSSPETKTVIKARWNQNFTFENFKTVIDNKTKDWLTNAKYSKFLRPQTLFGTKFEGYLNEKHHPLEGVVGEKTIRTIENLKDLELS